MDDNNNPVGADDTTTTSNTETSENTVTMTKDEFDKVIQSSQDKLRSKYSKEIKDLQAKIKELSPVQKSDAEIELENRLTELENKQKEVEAKEKLINLRTTLQAKNIDANLADYVKSDIDIDKFSALVNGIVDSRIKTEAFQPKGHQNNNGMTKEKFNKLSYTEQVKFMEKNPELTKTFLNK